MFILKKIFRLKIGILIWCDLHAMKGLWVALSDSHREACKRLNRLVEATRRNKSKKVVEGTGQRTKSKELVEGTSQRTTLKKLKKRWLNKPVEGGRCESASSSNLAANRMEKRPKKTVALARKNVSRRLPEKPSLPIESSLWEAA